MAVALSADTMSKLYTVGGAFVAGFAEAAAYRFNQTLGTIVTFGGVVAGLLMSMNSRGTMSDIGLGIASSSAGSIGHIAIKQLWPSSTRARAFGAAVQRRPLALADGGARVIGGVANRETADNELKV